jgi:hypothetical protein
VAAPADQPPATDQRPTRSRPVFGAWQPLTGGGVAAFGAASFVRTLAFQLVFALGASLVIVWSVRHAWFPPITEALTRLPGGGAEIVSGRLRWPDTNAVALAESPQLGLAVDPAGTDELGRTADLQVQLRRDGVRLEGLFGHQLLAYPPDLAVPLDCVGGTAAWGAWNWVGLVFVGLATLVTLFALWWSTALALALPVWLAAFVFRRALTLGGAWRLTAAAWLPATLVLLGGVSLYATHGVRLTGLAVLTAAHLAIPILWLIWGLCRLPARTAPKRSANPFGSNTSANGSSPAAEAKSNPFK